MKHRAVVVMDWETVKYLLKWPKDLKLEAIRCQRVEVPGTIEMIVEGDVPRSDPFGDLARITPRYEIVESGDLRIASMRGFVSEHEAKIGAKRGS